MASSNRCAQGWESKKKTAKAVSNPLIDEIQEAARKAGASAGKVSQAPVGVASYCSS